MGNVDHIEIASDTKGPLAAASMQGSLKIRTSQSTLFTNIFLD